MSKWLRGLLVAVALFSVSLGATASVPGYAKSAFLTWQNSVISSGTIGAGSTSYLSGQYQIGAFTWDSTRTYGGGLSCTLNLGAEVAYPFLYSTASTVGTTVTMFNSKGVKTTVVWGDTFAVGLPMTVSRAIFTYASADTPAGFFIAGIPVTALKNLR